MGLHIGIVFLQVDFTMLVENCGGLLNSMDVPHRPRDQKVGLPKSWVVHVKGSWINDAEA